MKRKKIDLLQNIVIFLLFLSMVAMSVLTFVMTTWSDNLDIDGPWFDMSVIDNPDSEGKYELDPSLLIPAAAGIKTDTLKLCDFANEVIVSELSSFLYDKLKAVCSEGVSLSLADAGFSLSERIENLNYVFVQYRSPMPMSVIAAFGGLTSYSDLGISDRVSDIFLFAHDDGTEVVIKAGDGKLYSAKSSVEPGYAAIENYAYTNRSSMCSFDFSCETDLTAFASDTVLLTTGNKSLQMYDIEKLNAYTAVDSDLLESLLDVFSFNPDKLSSNKPTDDSVTYVETHGTLSIDYVITYTAISDGGVDLSSYVDDKTMSGVERFIRVSGVIAESLVKDFARGGTLKLRLDSVSSEGGELVVKYVYTLGNVPVMKNSENCGLELRFDEDKLIGARLDLIKADAASDKSSMFTGLWSAQLYVSRNPDNCIYNMLAYYNAADDTATSAAWQVQFTEGGRTNELD